MNAQDELKQLREKVEQLQKALEEKQQLSTPDLPSLRENHELVVDCARFAEGILSEQQVRKRWHFDDATWAQLGEDD